MEQNQRPLLEEKGGGTCRRAGRKAEKGTVVRAGRRKRILAQRPRSRIKNRGRNGEVGQGPAPSTKSLVEMESMSQGTPRRWEMEC